MEKTQLMKGILESCTLKIIEKSETYGYEIVEQLQQYGFEDVKEGRKIITNSLPHREYHPQDIDLFQKEYEQYQKITERTTDYEQRN